MKINRPTSTENIRPFLLFLVMMTTLSLVPMLSHGAVFWDDEMEQGNTDFSAAYMLSTMIPNGIMAYDTTTKYSGNGSIRVNFPASCDITGAEFLANQCGGSITRIFPDQASIWRRVYFRMSGRISPGGACITADCLFHSSQISSTKMMQGQSLSNNAYTESNIRLWWQMGKIGGKTFILSAEHVPTFLRTTDVFSSKVLQDNTWYCLETHEVVNTPGVANGVGEAWIDGVKVLTRNDLMWQRAESTSAPGNFLWHQFQLVRQNGAGYFWWDRFAAGNTRIGCLGATPASDTTRPAPPQGFVIR